MYKPFTKHRQQEKNHNKFDQFCPILTKIEKVLKVYHPLSVHISILSKNGIEYLQPTLISQFIQFNSFKYTKTIIVNGTVQLLD